MTSHGFGDAVTSTASDQHLQSRSQHIQPLEKSDNEIHPLPPAIHCRSNRHYHHYHNNNDNNNNNIEHKLRMTNNDTGRKRRTIVLSATLLVVGLIVVQSLMMDERMVESIQSSMAGLIEQQTTAITSLSHDSVFSSADASTDGGGDDDDILPLFDNETELFANLTSDKFDGHMFCISWNYTMDEWWTHHPDWEAHHENDDKICFRRIQGKNKNNNKNNNAATVLKSIYRNQFTGANCSNVYTRYMWSSGWGADFYNVGTGLLHAVNLNRPLAITNIRRKMWWHYSAVKADGSNPTCPAKDMSCYFLPIGKCSPNRADVDGGYVPERPNFQTLLPITYQYATRPQQWLRRAVYDYVRDVEKDLTEPCSVIHVRRSDVVLHGQASRKYFPISDYIRLLPPERRDNGTVFLLTDDANAIDEAHEFHPNIRWKYLNRTRHRGTAGGWENQTPSKSPKQETIIILSTFRLVQRCDYLVHADGRFSDALMESMSQKRTVVRKKLGSRFRSQIRNEKNKNSHLELEEKLNELRRQQGNTSKVDQANQTERQRRRLLQSIEADYQVDDEYPMVLEAVQFSTER